MTAPDVNADVRARFEAWATDEGYAVERYKDSYQAADTRNAWWGFQAAHADLSGEVRELVEDAGRAIAAWDSTTLPRVNDGMLQERMESLRAALAKFTHQEKP